MRADVPMDDDSEKPFRKLLRGAPPALPLTSHACARPDNGVLSRFRGGDIGGAF